MSENIGCLGSILNALGLLPKQNNKQSKKIENIFPYVLRDDFLSAAELNFYKSLSLATKELPVKILSKVSLGDLFFVNIKDFKMKQSYWNKINRKHVDFLVCDNVSLKPLVAIELDDKSHQQSNRVQRDAFVDEVFKAANLPLLHIPVKNSYAISELTDLIQSQMKTNPIIASITSEDYVPICPKCQIPMTLRETKKGNHIGQKFYGCSTFPKCKEIKPYN
ncbi:DUF2726 domain-containing protein [Turicibacter sanguinis]|uniref:DUF2726 domain-containing protein n=1 Tax=Turicibacter sanguinis TaxID=154288 RepID=UPI0018A8C9A8|nr:DUF2726 domain-containing protein [Turicibacter sanguinis]